MPKTERKDTKHYPKRSVQLLFCWWCFLLIFLFFSSSFFSSFLPSLFLVAVLLFLMRTIWTYLKAKESYLVGRQTSKLQMVYCCRLASPVSLNSRVQSKQIPTMKSGFCAASLASTLPQMLVYKNFILLIIPGLV